MENTGVLAGQHKGVENAAKRYLVIRMTFAVLAVFIVFFGAPVFAGTSFDYEAAVAIGVTK